MVRSLGRLKTCSSLKPPRGIGTFMWAENSADVNPSSFNILRMSASTFLCSFPVSSAISRLLIIANTAIRTDVEGRYCLNDLHKAAGGEKTHQPSNFFRLDSTNGLIDELDKSSDMRNIAVVTIPGRKGGTYVAKERVSEFGDCSNPGR